jgi:hypothetical protein
VRYTRTVVVDGERLEDWREKMIRFILLTLGLLMLSSSIGCDDGVGLNPCGEPGAEGDRCTQGHDEQCLRDLICYDYTDAVMDCGATCLPVGSECVEDQDCVEAGTGDVCVEGYCETCCPG